MAFARAGVTVTFVLETASPDLRCATCGALPQAFDFACAECMRRWEEMECRQLRERLFGLSTPPMHGH